MKNFYKTLKIVVLAVFSFIAIFVIMTTLVVTILLYL